MQKALTQMNLQLHTVLSDLSGATGMQAMPAKVDEQARPLGPRQRGKRPSGNAPRFDLRRHLYRISGVDWTRGGTHDCVRHELV